MSTPDWWGNWRPSLPAHTGDLQPTDLIECTSIVGGLPVNTAITGQQIINAASGGSTSWGNIGGTLSNQTDLQTALNAKQATLVSGTNIKTVNGNSLVGSGNLTISSNPRTLASLIGSNLIGTSNQISTSYKIAGSTLIANNTIYINGLLTKTAGSTSSTSRIYINTSNTLTGATQIATLAGMTGANYHQRYIRSFYFDGTHLNIYSPSNGVSSDLVQGAILRYAFNAAIDYFLIFAVQNSTTTPDDVGHKRVIIQLYD